MPSKRHSAPVLSDLRDGWWNPDYLQLIIGRLRLSTCRRVVDVGCGHGHWGQLLIRLLSEDTSLIGVDQEPDWVDKASARAAELNLSARCTYRAGSAETLPLDDASADLVTCQTLLMHVRDVKPAVREMLRVLKPGGRLLLAEPNNVAHQLAIDSAHDALSPQQLGAVMELFTACSRGRRHLGRGDDCMGERLVEVLRNVGCTDVGLSMNDHADILLPPYTDSDQAGLDRSVEMSDSDFWLWNRDDACALFVAGGGEAERFDECYAAFQKRTATFNEQVADAAYRRTGGALHYLVSGTKPTA